jgi:hypothetical protein
MAKSSACAYVTPCVYPGAENGNELVSITLNPVTGNTLALKSTTTPLSALFPSHTSRRRGIKPRSLSF